MNLSAEKLDIIQRICEIQDNDLIDLIKNIITVPNVSKSDWWSHILKKKWLLLIRGLMIFSKGKSNPTIR